MQFRVHFEDGDGNKKTQGINAESADAASKLIRRHFDEPIVIHKIKLDREVHVIPRKKAHA